MKEYMFKKVMAKSCLSVQIRDFFIFDDDLLVLSTYLHNISKIYVRNCKTLNIEINRAIRQAYGNVLCEIKNKQKKNGIKNEMHELVINDNIEIEYIQTNLNDLISSQEITFDNTCINSICDANNNTDHIILKHIAEKRLFRRIHTINCVEHKNAYIFVVVSKKLARMAEQADNLCTIEHVRNYNTYDLIDQSDNTYEQTHFFSSSMLSSNIFNELEQSGCFCFNDKLLMENIETRVNAFCKLLDMLEHKKVRVVQIDFYSEIYVYVQ